LLTFSAQGLILCSASAPSQTLVSLSYVFDQEPGAGVVNNGNVVQVVNNINNERTQSYTYDELNRILTAQSQATSGEHCWGNAFGYDIWANLLAKSVTQCAAEPLSVTVNTKNQITNTGFTYDAAGNMTNAGAGVMTYDAENRLTNAAGVSYVYDGDGKRVKKSGGMLYWTGVGSDALVETNLTDTGFTEFIFFAGRRISMHGDSGVVYHYVADHLGSMRVMSTATAPILQDYDYYPFGGTRVVVDLLGGQHYKFTGKERDGESGLDYFGARYYASGLGRFLQPDEFTGGPVDAFSSNDPVPPGPLPYADMTNPQSLNKYTYTLNNPLRYTDPGGHCTEPVSMLVCLGIGIAAEEFYFAAKKFDLEIQHLRDLEANNQAALENVYDSCLSGAGAGDCEQALDLAVQTAENLDIARAQAALAGLVVAMSVPGTSATGPIPTTTAEAAAVAAQNLATQAAVEAETKRRQEEMRREFEEEQEKPRKEQ